MYTKFRIYLSNGGGWANNARVEAGLIGIKARHAMAWHDLPTPLSPDTGAHVPLRGASRAKGTQPDRKGMHMSHPQPIFPRPLRRDIIAIVAIKIVALIAIHQIFFASDPAERVTAASAASQIFGPGPVTAPPPASSQGE